MNRVWLRDYSWEFVTAQNAMLCEAKKALHKPTSDGHESTRVLWQENYLSSGGQISWSLRRPVSQSLG